MLTNELDTKEPVESTLGEPLVTTPSAWHDDALVYLSCKAGKWCPTSAINTALRWFLHRSNQDGTSAYCVGYVDPVRGPVWNDWRFSTFTEHRLGNGRLKVLTFDQHLPIGSKRELMRQVFLISDSHVSCYVVSPHTFAFWGCLSAGTPPIALPCRQEWVLSDLDVQLQETAPGTLSDFVRLIALEAFATFGTKRQNCIRDGFKQAAKAWRQQHTLDDWDLLPDAEPDPEKSIVARPR